MILTTDHIADLIAEMRAEPGVIFLAHTGSLADCHRVADLLTPHGIDCDVVSWFPGYWHVEARA